MKNINKNTKQRVIIYGGNFLGKFLGVGNPTGAVLYGGLDALNKFSKTVNSSKASRLLKAGGFGWYTVFSAKGIGAVVSGDFSQIAQLPFDASMTYLFGKDTLANYGKKSRNNFWEDIIDTGKYLKTKLGKIKGIGKKKTLESKVSDNDISWKDGELSELSPKDTTKLNYEEFERWMKVVKDDELIKDAKDERILYQL